MKRLDQTPHHKLAITIYLQSIIIAFCALFLSIPISAQDYIYKNYGVDEGLPSSEVYDIYQDKEGYILFATDKGISRYNGYEFENFDSNNGLTGNVVLRFYPQDNGQIWCYTLHKKTLFYFNEEFDGFYPFEHNEALQKHLNKASIVKSIYVDKDETVHIGGHQINGEIVIKKNGEIKTRYVSDNYFNDTLNLKKNILNPISDAITSTSHFVSMDTAHLGKFVFQNNHISARLLIKWHVENEVALFSNVENVTVAFKDKENIIIESEYSPIGLSPIDDNHFFVGYEFGGGKIMNLQGNIIKEFLKNESITGFLIDHEGGYWFTTLSSGAYYIQNPSLTIYKSNKSKSHEVNSLVKTNQNELLIGYINGVVSKIPKNRKMVFTDHPKETMKAFIEYDSHLDKTYQYNGYTLHLKDTLIQDFFIKLSEPNGGSLFASAAQDFSEITTDNKVINWPYTHRVHDICLWNNDTLVATPLGVYKYHKGKGIPMTNESPLFSYRSDDIDVNNNTNTVYVATQGGGLIIKDTTTLMNLTEKDGLNSDIINEIHIENDSTIWICTNRGINGIIMGEQGITISSMSKKNGLLSNEVKDLEVINDTMWVGTKQGLCSFPKSQLSPKKIEVPELKLKDVLVNDIYKHPQIKARLNHKENKIYFVLEGITYNTKKDVYFQYRLNKSDSWSTALSRHMLFSSLSPGDYSFEAKMCIDDHNCTEEAVLYEFKILPPFWKTWWFRFVCLWFTGLLVYSFFRIKVLTYNKDVIRELIRLIIKNLKREERYFSFRENGNDVRIKTEDIIYIKSAGNYIDVHTSNKTHTIRLNIGKFLDNVPDRLEFVRLHRSYIVRIDKITRKSKNEVQLFNGEILPVSLNHHKKLKEVVF